MKSGNVGTNRIVEQLRERWRLCSAPPPPSLEWMTDVIRQASGCRMSRAGAADYARFLRGDSFLMDLIAGKEALP